MQMEPHLGDLNWLSKRFDLESPFIFYHAALAMRNMAIGADQEKRARISEVAAKAKATIEAFEYGTPDPETIEVLSTL